MEELGEGDVGDRQNGFPVARSGLSAGPKYFFYFKPYCLEVGKNPWSEMKWKKAPIVPAQPKSHD